jgi:(2S)-methylsuccinyl-CoA dehydrogenase
MNAAIPDIGAAGEAVASASEVTAAAARQLAGSEGGVDANQVVAYDLAQASAALECARAALDYGGRGEVEARLAAAFVADAVHDTAGRVLGREEAWGVEAGALDDALELVRPWRASVYLAALAGEPGPRHLDSDLVLVQDTFRRVRRTVPPSATGRGEPPEFRSALACCAWACHRKRS